MKINKSFCFSWLVLTCAGTVVQGQPFSTDINPALTYYQAFMAAPELSDKDRDYLFTNEWRGQKLPDRFGELLAGYDNEFRLLRQAAQSTVACDWGIDFGAGPETLLPHLSRVKTAAQAARLRVMWDLQQNQQTNASEDLLAALAVGRNASRDGALISALVQFAVERIVCITVGENFNHFSPEALSQISDGLGGPPAQGTVAESIEAEKTFKYWFINRIADLVSENPGNDAKVMEGFHKLYDSTMADSEGKPETNNTWAQLVAASGGTSDGIIKLLREEMDPLYDRLANIETLPRAQYEEQMKEFMSEVRNSANPFVHELFPALEKCRPKEFGATADLAMVQAAIQYKLHGQAGLNSVTNPLGQGPFSFQRFMFDGVDRGFELNADYSGVGFPEVFIFVESDGPPFAVYGKSAGKTPKP